jgi:hypothetical protein
MSEKEPGVASAEDSEGVVEHIADIVGEEARHLGHNFAENFPGLVEGVEHLVEEHPKVQETLDHLGHNFEENFPHLTGQAKEGEDA